MRGNRDKSIRIFHECEVQIEKSIQVMPNSDPEGRIFLSALNNHDRFFFLHTFWSLAFDFNVELVINQSCWRPPYLSHMSDKGM